ncbi:MAG: cation:dicarboxylase symporter family transporter [Pseudomonadota bacterium]
MLMLLNLSVFVALLFFLARLKKRDWSLSQQVLTALVIGALAGTLMQSLYGNDSEIVHSTLTWTNMIGSGYVSLLKMIVMPLVLVSMIAAVVKMDEVSQLSKYGGLILLVLIGTTVIASSVAIGISLAFDLTADGLAQGARELARAETLSERQGEVDGISLPSIIVSFIPQNIFADLAGTRDTSIIAVVIFGILVGIAGLRLFADEPEQGARFKQFIETALALVMRLVRMIIALTPFGVFALMFKVGASSSLTDILDLVRFIAASYLAIIIMFCVHALILFLNGVNVRHYFQSVWPVLTFAFSSRSSAATIPLNVETQINRLNVKPVIANLSASLGATIGQNGCAGIYPAMLAVMIAPSVGVDPTAPTFIISLIGIIAISSFGVAGVGGGATLAALIVLPAMGLPVALAALLISIEPLIDMARTALNVNGAMTAGKITQQRVYGDTKAEPTGDLNVSERNV